MTDHRTFTHSELFNCCSHFGPPRWADFTSLEVAAFTETDGETESGQPFDGQGVHFAIYGRTHDGEVSAITDILNDADALPIAGHLSRLSGLPVTLYRP